MTIGIGGSNAEIELSKLTDMTNSVEQISKKEFKQRINKANVLMKKHNIAATYVNAGTNLYYFTGTKWYASERMVGALISQKGEIHYIVPNFEEDTIKQFILLEGKVHCWHEHENPYQLFVTILAEMGIDYGTIALSEDTHFFIADGIKNALKEKDKNLTLINAKVITAGCRAEKSDHEIALLQQAKNMTLEVQKSAAKILRVGISTTEVTNFINQAHKKVGAAQGSFFCIVLFGKDTSYPHGVKTPKKLEQDDMVLIDTGCLVEGYNSDITRSYVFGTPTEKQRAMWLVEKNAQLAAFNASQIGVACGQADIAAREYIASQDLGPDYQTPGCPHRTGHGIGLDIHEWPYLVKSDDTPLSKGMCFSNEPMLVFPEEFGIRLEDHFYITDNGPKWFTEPAFSLDDPFGAKA